MESFGGVLFPAGLHTQESLRLALNVPFQETDVLVVSYPKSGKDSRTEESEMNDEAASSPTRHHVDAGDPHSHPEQRRPPPVPHRPQLGSGSLAGAPLLC